MKKIVALLLALLMAIGMMSFASADDKIIVTFQNGYTGPDGAVLTEIVDKFNAENDKNIFIQMEIMSGGVLYEKLPYAISTGTACDFTFLGDTSYIDYYNQGLIRCVDDFWAYEGVNKDDFDPGVLANVTTAKGETVGIPYDTVVYPMYWNKTLFEKAGLDPETPPQTYDEFIEYAIKIADPDNGIFGVSLPVNDMTLFYHMLYANGGDVLNADKNASTLNSEATLKTLQDIQKLVEAGAIPKGLTGGETDTVVLAGQVGMCVNGPWMVSGLNTNEINYGVVPFPGEGAMSATDFIFIPSSTPEEKIPAIYEFAKYFSTTEVKVKWALEAGYPPITVSAAADEAVKANYVISQMGGCFAKVVPNWKVGIPYSGLISDEAVTPMVEKVMNGEDPAAAMAEADAIITSIIAEYAE